MQKHVVPAPLISCAPPPGGQKYAEECGTGPANFMCAPARRPEKFVGVLYVVVFAWRALRCCGCLLLASLHYFGLSYFDFLVKMVVGTAPTVSTYIQMSLSGLGA